MLQKLLRSSNSYFIIWSGLLVLFYISIRNLAFYQINDDFFLFGIASGVPYGQPSSDLIFISSPINYILQLFYEIIPSVNWYFEIYLFNLLLALWIFAYLLKLRFNPNEIYTGLVYLILNIIPIFILTQKFYLIQFSQIAIISAAIGFITLLEKTNEILRLVGFVLLLLGFSWRSEAAIIGVGLVLVIYLFHLYIQKELDKIKNKSFFGTLLFIVVLFTFKSISFLGILPFFDSAKNDFKKLNYDIMRTYDFAPNSDVRKAQLEEAKSLGWSKNDFTLYTKTYFSDSSIYSSENLDLLAKGASPQYTFNYFIKSGIEFLFLMKNNHLSILFTIILITMLVAILISNKYLKVFAALFTLFFGFFFLVYLLGKLPDRIFWPLVFIFTITNIFHLEIQKTKEIRTKTLISFISLFLIAFSLSVSQYKDLFEMQWWKSVREDKTQGFDRVLSYEPDKPIIAFSSFYSPLIQTLDPKSNRVDQIFQDMIYINWAQRSPDYIKYLSDLRINEDLFTEIAFGNAYLGTSNLEELQMVNQYLIEHHDIEPIWDIAPFVFSDTGLGIWKIVGVR